MKENTFVESCGGILHVNPNTPLIYFENDRYINKKTGRSIPIRFQSGLETISAEEAWKKIEEYFKKANKPSKGEANQESESSDSS